jgi:hypothetical protein
MTRGYYWRVCLTQGCFEGCEGVPDLQQEADRKELHNERPVRRKGGQLAQLRYSEGLVLFRGSCRRCRVQEQLCFEVSGLCNLTKTRKRESI